MGQLPSSKKSASAERRETPRRKRQLRVHLCNDEDGAEPTTAWVVDRSVGGLSLSVAQAYGKGAVLRVRPSTPADAPWVRVEVTSCRQEENAWLLGCRFVRSPSYSVLLQFG